MDARVTAGARLHFGFQNLSLARERLYGGIGVAVDAPRVVVTAEPADGVVCDRESVRPYVERTVDLLGVDGARVAVESTLPRHVGLGSGTRHALAALAAVAAAHDRDPAVRERAPALGRGGRSGVGVAGFERGGFVVDAGHPTTRFTTDRPDDGQWTVPAVAVRHDVPDDWRFVVVLPETDPGRCGEDEDDAMRSVVERADPDLADEIARVRVQRLLPAIVGADVEAFGAAAAEIGRLNGAWYADVQGGVYRPPVGSLVEALSDSPAVYGAGQSSWGPAVYGVTTRNRAGEAGAAAREALDAVGVAGEVHVVAGCNRGVAVEPP